MYANTCGTNATFLGEIYLTLSICRNILCTKTCT